MVRTVQRSSLDSLAKWHYIECQMETTETTRDVERYQQFLRLNALPGPHAYVVLLGMDYFDLPSILKAVEKGFPWKTFERFVKNIGLPADQVARLIAIPPRTLARRKAEKRFSSDESDRLLRAARVFAKTLKLFDGDRAAATDWLTMPLRALRAIPLEVARTDIGAREVENVIGALENGMFL
jgi:putative toxin-antitoxin system antitoxin component (TIGR02293 family)